MAAPQPNQLITGTGVQWTRLSTDLTQFRDTAGYDSKGGPAPIGAPYAVPNVPRIGGFDVSGRGLIAPTDLDNIPVEIHAIVNLFSQGLAASFFNGAAIAAPPTAFLDFVFAASLLYEYLGLFLRRGIPRGAAQ